MNLKRILCIQTFLRGLSQHQYHYIDLHIPRHRYTNTISWSMGLALLSTEAVDERQLKRHSLLQEGSSTIFSWQRNCLLFLSFANSGDAFIHPWGLSILER